MMNSRLLTPERPQPHPEQPQVGAIQAPLIYVKEKPVWAYKQLVRDLKKEPAPTEEDLNQLGKDGWELAGMFTQESTAYFYFKKRED